MSDSKSTATPSNVEPGQPRDADGNLLKPCCCCKEEKKALAVCIETKGEDNCEDLMEAHDKCLRDLGFDV